MQGRMPAEPVHGLRPPGGVKLAGTARDEAGTAIQPHRDTVGQVEGVGAEIPAAGHVIDRAAKVSKVRTDPFTRRARRLGVQSM
jgi:hypothetical protein